MHIRQTEVAASVAVGKFLMIETKEVKQRGMQIVYMDLVLRCREAKLIRRSVHQAFL